VATLGTLQSGRFSKKNLLYSFISKKTKKDVIKIFFINFKFFPKNFSLSYRDIVQHFRLQFPGLLVDEQAELERLKVRDEENKIKLKKIRL
jgi:hypothetical protein